MRGYSRYLVACARMHGAGGGRLCATDHGSEHAADGVVHRHTDLRRRAVDGRVDASASFDTGGSVATYAWDFGDGGSATGVTSTHQYTGTAPSRSPSR